MAKAKKIKMDNKKSPAMAKDFILASDEYISNTFFCARKDWFIRNCTIDSKIDTILETKAGSYKIENGTIDTEIKIPAEAMREFMNPTNDNEVQVIDLFSKLAQYCICNGKIVLIDKEFTQLVTFAQKVTYTNRQFYIWENDEVVITIAEMENRRDVKECFEEMQKIADTFKGMIPVIQ
jgi:hypothetical protein